MVPRTAELPNSTNTTAVQENAAESLIDRLHNILTSGD
jgi:hypothetical protein